MKISIVTTCYNSEKYIEETIESVLLQRGDFSIEYIIVDANSSDSTFEIIKKQKSLIDTGFYSGRNNGVELKIIREADNGMYDGLVKGLKDISGDIVAYINSDDFYMPNAFSLVTHIFKKYADVNWLTGIVNSYSDKKINSGGGGIY